MDNWKKMILNLRNSNGKVLIFFFAALFCLGLQSVSAQQAPKPKATATPSPTLTCPPGIPCGKIQPYPKPGQNAPVIIRPRPNPTPPRDSKRVVVNEGYTAAEKAIQTEPKVIINLCVIQGNVRINGWERDEVRAYVEDGSQVGFKIVEYNKNKKPAWVSVLGFDPKNNKEIKPEECLSGNEIALDVPRNATVKLKSGESAIKIESVAKVAVESLSGDILLNEIANGIDATTYQGDLMVEKSSGQIILTNTAGNIIALGVSPSEVGDIFKAKTNSGRITLKAVEHRFIETGTISGATTFDGELLASGQYSFSTQNGSIILAVPATSVCKINAWFGFGAFGSEIPLQNTLKKEQSLSAQIGGGDAACTLNLKTGSGGIRLRKKLTEKEQSTPEPEKPVKPVKPVSMKKACSESPAVAATADLDAVAELAGSEPKVKDNKGKKRR